MNYPIIIEKHYGIHILRDDLLPGGTKSILMPSIESRFPDAKEIVYSSPVYGGFQIALSKYFGEKTTIFCARRKVMYSNTLLAKNNGAKIMQVYPGYLSVIEKRARDYCIHKNNENNENTIKLEFGANTEENINLISERAKQVYNKMKKMNKTIDEIYVACGSGLILSGILKGVPNHVKVVGVQVGKEITIIRENLQILKYHQPFEKESKIKIDFPSMANYDRKAFEYCLKYAADITNKNILFWNVL